MFAEMLFFLSIYLLSFLILYKLLNAFINYEVKRDEIKCQKKNKKNQTSS